MFPDYTARKLIILFSSPRNKKTRKKEQIILKRATRSSIIFDDKKLSIYQWGDGEKLAILFHGWDSNAGSLGGFVSLLVEKGYKVIGFDAPAHGNSKGKRANLIYFRNAAKVIIEKYGVPDLAIGHSLGANSIIMAAYEDNISIKKAILICPLNRLLSVFEDFNELLQLNENLYKRFIKLFEEKSGYIFEDFYFHKYAQAGPIKEVLLLHDINDKVTNYSHSLNMSKNWNKVELHSIKGSGHYKILWNPNALNKASSFI